MLSGTQSITTRWSTQVPFPSILRGRGPNVQHTRPSSKSREGKLTFDGRVVVHRVESIQVTVRGGI